MLRESKDRAVYGLAKEEGECWHGSENRNMAGAFKACGYLRERERERESARQSGGGAEREMENPKQAPCSLMSEWGSNSRGHETVT